MALKVKLDDDDISLLEIIEDKVWLGEFLRSTGDGEVDKQLHPSLKWSYRDYQRQFLSDDTEFILYTGGRAIGKCQPSNARIYTSEGYKTIAELIKRKYFITYALTPEMTIEQRRAIAVFDKYSNVYKLITENGYEFNATKNHPILTPDGYRLLGDLKIGDSVAVATQLPHISNSEALQWYELRLLGYVILAGLWRVESPIKPRYRKIAAELEVIADEMLINWHKDFDGNYKFIRKPGPFPHPITSLLKETGLYHPMRQYGARSIPDIIKMERLENIAVFIEALYSQYGELSTQEVSINVPNKQFAFDLQELLLRFEIETKIIDKGNQWQVITLDYRAVYRFFQKLQIPGVTVGKMKLPAASNDATDFIRYETIKSIKLTHENTETYAVYVYKDNNYIGDGFYVHNSVVLEDKIVYEIVNHDLEFPVTWESVLVTPNQAQMTPLLNKLILRFTASRFLRDFLKNNINRSEGVMKFPIRNKPMIFNFRIAGSRGENNMVGLHVPRIRGDEMQLFPMNAFTQLQPAYNQWEPKRQQLHAGVPNGLRNSVLYVLDQQTPKYKKYRIPSHNNPFYTKEDDNDNIRRYGGENDDRYQQLVLGRHGAAAFQVIPRETISVETFAFYNYRYTSSQVLKGVKYDEVLQRPDLPDAVESVILAVDPGFVDPTLIQVIGMDSKGIWRVYSRYRLTRIDFSEQEKIIDWLATYYKANIISMDIGAGG